MFDAIKRLFGRKKRRPEFTQEEYEQRYELKKEAMEKVLGEMHELVGIGLFQRGRGGLGEKKFRGEE